MVWDIEICAVTVESVCAVAVITPTFGPLAPLVINVGEGQTQMAIYGIGSGQRAYMTKYYASAIKSGAAATASVRLCVNPEPDSELTAFLTKHTNGIDTSGVGE